MNGASGTPGATAAATTAPHERTNPAALPRLTGLLPPWVWAVIVFLAVFPTLTVANVEWAATDPINGMAYVARTLVGAVALFWASGRPGLPARLRHCFRILAATSSVGTFALTMDTLAHSFSLNIWPEPLDRTVVLLEYVTATIGLLVYPMPPLRGRAWRSFVLDTAITVGGIGTLLAAAVLVPRGQPTDVQALVVVYRIGNILVLVGINAVALRGLAAPSARSLWLFLGGQVAYVPTLLLASYEVAGSTRPLGDLTYFWGPISTIFAAFSIRHDPHPEAPVSARPHWLQDFNPMPLVTTLFVAGALVVTIVYGPEARVAPLAFALIGVSALLVARLALSFRENARLLAIEATREREEVRVRAETVGRLAGGIAHEFNNLMTTVLGHAEIGGQELPADSPVQQDLQRIREAGQRAAALTEQLLLFSGHRVGHPQRSLDLSALLQGVEPRLRRLVPAAITVETRIAPGISVNADSRQIAGMVEELIRNAVAAMGKTGRIVLILSEEQLTTALPTPFVSVPAGRYATLAVADSGCGIGPEQLPHIFEPFYSSRPKPEAAGMGLAAVYGIVVGHRGGIEVESALGRGTEVRVYLPLREKPLSPSAV